MSAPIRSHRGCNPAASSTIRQSPPRSDTSVWPPTDLNQRFWKDYIDYVLGVMQTDSNGDYTVINSGKHWIDGLWRGL